MSEIKRKIINVCDGEKKEIEITEDLYSDVCVLHDKFQKSASEWIEIHKRVLSSGETDTATGITHSIDRDAEVRASTRIAAYREICFELALLATKYEPIKKACSNCASLYLKDMNIGCCNNPKSKKGVVDPGECCELHEFREKK